MSLSPADAIEAAREILELDAEEWHEHESWWEHRGPMVARALLVAEAKLSEAAFWRRLDSTLCRNGHPEIGYRSGKVADGNCPLCALRQAVREAEDTLAAKDGEWNVSAIVSIFRAKVGPHMGEHNDL